MGKSYWLENLQKNEKKSAEEILKEIDKREQQSEDNKKREAAYLLVINQNKKARNLAYAYRKEIKAGTRESYRQRARAKQKEYLANRSKCY